MIGRHNSARVLLLCRNCHQGVTELQRQHGVLLERHPDPLVRAALGFGSLIALVQLVRAKQPDRWPRRLVMGLTTLHGLLAMIEIGTDDR